ncbi:hypothetical protein GCM10010399_18850 [Dactylosporangium fulvum]|uniref:DUF2637 domain-containing protein n=1 Tax=Dactylosporangium fulvum TaxID=53359 RepID=A0ABY5VUY0_9ACTN|nr:hypothetical protein [Dactylosporangium fulvum]UWP80293.1 hypothetical protein Dfulv_34740 [Dactylosporangium fulvum]
MMTPQQRRAVRVVVGLLVAGLALGMAFAALTLIFRGNVLAYQQNRHPHADPAALARTLWTRPIPILIVAGLYVWVARQLLAGAHRAYRRVRIVSVLGFVAVGWLFVSAEDPAWLRVVQGVQLAVLAARSAEPGASGCAATAQHLGSRQGPVMSMSAVRASADARTRRRGGGSRPPRRRGWSMRRPGQMPPSTPGGIRSGQRLREREKLLLDEVECAHAPLGSGEDDRTFG